MKVRQKDRETGNSDHRKSLKTIFFRLPFVVVVLFLSCLRLNCSQFLFRTFDPARRSDSGCLPFTWGNRLVQMTSKISRMGNSARDKHASLVKFTLIYKESGTSFTIGGEPATEWNTICLSDIPVGNFELPLVTTSLDLLKSPSLLISVHYLSRRSVHVGRTNQNSLTIYSPTEIAEVFGKR